MTLKLLSPLNEVEQDVMFSEVSVCPKEDRGVFFSPITGPVQITVPGAVWRGTPSAVSSLV